jgi:hypothetical protein
MTKLQWGISFFLQPLQRQVKYQPPLPIPRKVGQFLNVLFSIPENLGAGNNPNTKIRMRDVNMIS